MRIFPMEQDFMLFRALPASANRSILPEPFGSELRAEVLMAEGRERRTGEAPQGRDEHAG